MTRFSVLRRRGVHVRAWHGLGFRDALLISAVPLAVVLWLVGASWVQYRRMQRFDDYYARAGSVERAFGERWRAGFNLPALIGLRERLDERTDDPSVLRLTVSGSGWDSLLSNDDPDWGAWTDADLAYGGTTIAGRVRRRGDTSVHWLTEKRSLGVRTPKREPYKAWTAFGLSGKDILEAYVSNGLASALGILAPATDIVPVFVNGRYYGLFRFVEPVDEAFLRQRGQTVGTVFRGDRAERGEYVAGQPRNLFENPGIWERPVPGDSNATLPALHALLADLADPSFAAAQRLRARFDAGEVERLIAYLLVCGDPYHMDGVHNQLLYLDPSSGRFRAIPWDVRLLPLDATPQGLSILMDAWLKDPRIVDGVTRRLSAMLRDSSAWRAADSLVSRVDRRFAQYFAYDERRGTIIPAVATPEAARGIVRRNLETLQSWLHNDTIAVGVTPSPNETVLDLETRGRAGADLVALDGVTGVRVWRDANLNGIHDAGDAPVDVRPAGAARVALVQPLPILAGWEGGMDIHAGHIPYRLFVSGADAALRPVLRNRATGAPATTVAWHVDDPIRPATGWHPWQYAATGRTRTMSGAVSLTGVTVIPEEDTLVIRPGTTIRMGPAASLIANGRVIARGTAAQPIRVVPAGGAWGTFAIEGRGADSSAMTHVSVTGGSGATVAQAVYRGALAVRGAHDVVLDNIDVQGATSVRAALEIAHAGVAASALSVERAAGAGAMIEDATGTIAGISVDRASASGITLLSSDIHVDDVRIAAPGGAGIVVNGTSRASITNARVSGAAAGIDVADAAAPWIANADLDSNRVAVRVTRGDARYARVPWPVLVNSRARHVAHDIDSRVTIWNDRTPADTGRPRFVERFEDTFEPDLLRWRRSSGNVRRDVRVGALTMEVERGTGAIERDVDWNLPNGGDLVAEVSGRDLVGGRIVAVNEQGEAFASFTAPTAPTVFSAVRLQLPSGHYRRLRIEATPQPGLSHVTSPSTGLSVVKPARLYLHRYMVFDGASR